ncbi:MAG: hypothetical protein LBF16_12435 [Pseudomonadales bacterium]|jgi:hypothetical protein|nr:hypothetical protein [Pseudomonadales bacterium]
MKIKEMLHGALWFGGLGPLFGAIPFWGFLFITDIGKPGEVFFIGVTYLPWAYLLGLIPAVVSGLIVGPFRQLIHSWPRYLGTGLLCSLISLAWGCLLLGEGEVAVINSITLFTGPAFVAGTIVARLWGHSA